MRIHLLLDLKNWTYMDQKFKKYEYLELSILDNMKNTFKNMKNKFNIKPGNGGTQKGGVAYTDGDTGGSMETKNQALSEDVKIVDIGSLLIYLNYSKRDISTHASTVRDLADPEVMAESADLIGDIGELILQKDNEANPKDSKLKLSQDSFHCNRCNKNDHFSNKSEHPNYDEKRP